MHSSYKSCNYVISSEGVNLFLQGQLKLAIMKYRNANNREKNMKINLHNFSSAILVIFRVKNPKFLKNIVLTCMLRNLFRTNVELVKKIIIPSKISHCT